MTQGFHAVCQRREKKGSAHTSTPLNIAANLSDSQIIQEQFPLAGQSFQYPLGCPATSDDAIHKTMYLEGFKSSHLRFG
ncbi:Fungal transcriptional regulatory protein, N-terminal [Penicillium digitatum]|uniref:Fungal transcriptional regulatory protein, N-terminal n=1 Tax=Penicillium digitatum TaxID=36651 RepID=A0A7T6XS08_PENDI|nr:Fungal transcriptional regulatory protein, N-terminal [Penicillium digitatum]